MKALPFILAITILCACNRSIIKSVRQGIPPGISHANPKHNYGTSRELSEKRDSSVTFTYVTKEGKEIYFSSAVTDSASGEVMASRELDQITITAKANNIAERNGIISLGFIVSVPGLLMDSNWQTEIIPVMGRGLDTIPLPPIILSGTYFKKTQKRGYQRFEKYLESIIPEDAPLLENFANLTDLEKFLERHLPQSLVLSGIKNENLRTPFGVSEQEIIENYLKKKQIERNKRKIAQKEKVFSKYVKTPYTSGARLDSILVNLRNGMDYHYTQEIVANEHSDKIKLWITGRIVNRAGMAAVLPVSETIEYSVSSVSAFTQDIIRYKTKVIEKKSVFCFDSRISFEKGKHTLDSLVPGNKAEIVKIRQILFQVFEGDVFDTDSVVITSSSSPEGSYRSNTKLSSLRAESIKRFLLQEVNSIIKNLPSRLSLVNDKEIVYDWHPNTYDPDKIITRTIAEDWGELYRLIVLDSVIINKNAILQHFEVKDPDRRESLLARHRIDFKHIKENIYPKLRRVTFELKLVRRGMVKDTIHTSEPDSLYSNGVDFLRKREYNKALAVLSDYRDINTAVAHISLGHDHSALEILASLEECAQQQYMIAIVMARQGKEEEAVQHFLRAKGLDPKMAYRGGLDPEISFIINKYNLNRDLFE